MRAVTREVEEVYGYPEKAEQRDARGRESNVSCYGEGAFAGHATALARPGDRFIEKLLGFRNASTLHSKPDLPDI